MSKAHQLLHVMSLFEVWQESRRNPKVNKGLVNNNNMREEVVARRSSVATTLKKRVYTEFRMHFFTFGICLQCLGVTIIKVLESAR